ncbi:MAG TPA: hypothetical protein VG365_05560 [Solirubrobacteraceae bacterium]|jgi:hypothetical protein|nr:hypothetical protein [Solirubrobacteraceae bacterium]
MQKSGWSPLTLVVASVSSAVAAVVVRELSAPGTIASAALTPLLVALFGELLHRPAHRLTHVARQRLTSRRNAEPGFIERIRRTPARWQRVLGTAIAAFVIGSVALTGWELLINHSLATARDRTTLWGGSVRRQPAQSTSEQLQTTTSPPVRAPASRRTGASNSVKPVHGTTKSTTTPTTPQSSRPETTGTTATTTATTTTTTTTTTTVPTTTTTTTPPSQLPPLP